MVSSELTVSDTFFRGGGSRVLPVIQAIASWQGGRRRGPEAGRRRIEDGHTVTSGRRQETSRRRRKSEDRRPRTAGGRGAGAHHRDTEAAEKTVSFLGGKGLCLGGLAASVVRFSGHLSACIGG